MWEAASAFPDSSHTSLEQTQTQVSWLQIQCTSPNHFGPPASFKYCSASIRKHPGAYCYWLALEMAGNKQAGFFPLSEPLYPSHHAPFSAVRRKVESAVLIPVTPHSTARWELPFASLWHVVMLSGCAVSSENTLKTYEFKPGE